MKYDFVNFMARKAKYMEDCILEEKFTSIDERFNQVDQRFDAVDQRFDSIDERLNKTFFSIDQRFDEVDQNFTAIKQDFNRMDERFDKVEQWLKQIAGNLAMFLDMYGIHESAINYNGRMVNDHERRITKLEGRAV